MKMWVLLLLFISSGSGLKRGCESIPKRANWTCEDYKYFMLQNNLDTTLKCIGYVIEDRPGLPKPLDFYAGRSFERLLEINENGMNIVFEEAFAYAYHDDRLEFPQCKTDQGQPIQFTYTDIIPYWWPQNIDVTNMVKYVFGHASPGHNFPYATLQSNGHYLMLSKGVMTLHCDFSFDWFPFDVHQCEASLDIKNDGVKVLPFDWNDLKNHWFYKNTFAPIFHPLWDIKVSLTGPYNQTINGERVQRITRTFDLRRKISGYFFHIFVPSFMLCIASTISLFIPYKLFAPRMTLSATSCLSMITLFNGAKDSWPSSVVAMRTWVVLCYITVFYTLISYCLALSLTRDHQQSEDKEESFGLNRKTRCKKWGRKIEKASKIFVPTYLLMFSTIFFIICFHKRLLSAE